MLLETTPIVGLPADRLYDWNPGLDLRGRRPGQDEGLHDGVPGRRYPSGD